VEVREHELLHHRSGVNASANELNGVSGMSIEIAWRLETGRPDVLIAVARLRHHVGTAPGDMSQSRSFT